MIPNTIRAVGSARPNMSNKVASPIASGMIRIRIPTRMASRPCNHISLLYNIHRYTSSSFFWVISMNTSTTTENKAQPKEAEHRQPTAATAAANRHPKEANRRQPTAMTERFDRQPTATTAVMNNHPREANRRQPTAMTVKLDRQLTGLLGREGRQSTGATGKEDRSFEEISADDRR